MRGTTVVLVACLVLIGCGSARKDVETISTAQCSPFFTDEEQAVAEGILDGMVLEHPRSSKHASYPSDGYELISREVIPPQRAFPRGATILRAVAPESGVAECDRMDLTATILMIPGRPPAVIDGGIPSKGTWGERHVLYDVGREHDILLVTEGEVAGLGGSILLTWWNTESNTADPFWGTGGEEDGRRFSHSLCVTAKGPRLTVFGIYSCKREAYEKNRAELEGKLAFPVEFVYDENRGW